MFIVHVVRNV